MTLKFNKVIQLLANNIEGNVRDKDTGNTTEF